MKPDKDVLSVALAFKVELAKHRMKYEWPKAKDITKTYHYRWFKKFLMNCREKHDLNMHESILVLKSIVEHAYHKGLLKKGATLLQRSDQVDIFIKSAYEEIEREHQINEEILKCKTLMDEKGVGYYTKREKRGGYTNLVKSFIDGRLSLQYMSVSKRCMRIFNKLDKDERALLPSIIELAKLRNKTIRLVGKDKIRNVLKEDFNG